MTIHVHAELIFPFPQWHIKPFGNPGSNLSTVTLRKGLPFNLVVKVVLIYQYFVILLLTHLVYTKDDQLFASLSDPPTPFSIETTGGGKVRYTSFLYIPSRNSQGLYLYVKTDFMSQTRTRCGNCQPLMTRSVSSTTPRHICSCSTGFPDNNYWSGWLQQPAMGACQTTKR